MTMGRGILGAAGLLALLAALAPASPPGKLRPQRAVETELATHIVTAMVKSIEIPDSGETPASEEKPEVTRYLFKVKVLKIEKGEKLDKGQTISFRGWRVEKASGKSVAARGLSYIPRVGEEVRIFLSRNDKGGYEVLVPNGIQTLAQYRSSAAAQGVASYLDKGSLNLCPIRRLR